ncbi:MAG: sugar phosphate isomerase/epimerase [Phycisphaerae bacterium]|nr:sugar phosphate isomerase/epimerase [Phycisphaerae bacterium]
MKTSATICLLPQLRAGPFLLHADGFGELGRTCGRAKHMGFDAVEILFDDIRDVRVESLRRILDDSGLRLASLSTGQATLAHGWTLIDPDPGIRRKARNFVKDSAALAEALKAGVVIGCMQGRIGPDRDRQETLSLLAGILSDIAASMTDGWVLLEPLNRYETDVANTLADGTALLERIGSDRCRLLADLFHMSIEEADLAASLRAAGDHLGHVHLADSNRGPAGAGHTDFAPVGRALGEIGFDGYLGVEALPRYDADTTARMSLEVVRQFFDSAAVYSVDFANTMKEVAR